MARAGQHSGRARSWGGACVTLAAHHVLLEREELDVEVQAEHLEAL